MYRALFIAALVAAAPMAQAAPAAPFPVTVSQTRQLPISGAAFYVAVGDEDIAAINVVTSRIVMISGKKTGVTNVVVFDQAGHVLYDGDIAVTAPSGQAVTVIRGSVSTGYVCAPACQAEPTGGGQVAANAAPAGAAGSPGAASPASPAGALPAATPQATMVRTPTLIR